MRPLRISLNTAHSACKPSSFISSFTHSYQVFLPLYPHISPLPPPHFYRPTSNHLHSYVPHAQTTSIYHTSPLLPRSEYPKDCTSPHFASYPSETPHTSISLSCALLLSRLCQIVSLHCPCLNPIYQHALDTGPKNLPLHAMRRTTGRQNGQ